MYVGDYLASNLGHEVINLLIADPIDEDAGTGDNKPRHFIYLNPFGSLDSSHSQLDIMLMTRYIGDSTFQVVAMAKGLEPADGVTLRKGGNTARYTDEQPDIRNAQLDYIKKHNIRYDGVLLNEIFNDAEQQNIFVTYKAETVLIPKDDVEIYIKYIKPENRTDKTAQQKAKENKEVFETLDSVGDKKVCVHVKNNGIPKTALKSYIYQDQSEFKDYDRIKDAIIDNDKLWQPLQSHKNDSIFADHDDKISLFDICAIENDENRISNALAYFMDQNEYRELWCDFLNDIFKDINLSTSYKVYREREAKLKNPEKKKTDEETKPYNKEDIDASGGRMDLLIVDDNHVIVIENKIKATISSKSNEPKKSQLNGYHVFCENFHDFDGKTKRYAVLHPNYNPPHIESDMQGIFKQVTYKALYDFLSEGEYKDMVDKDENFVALRNVLFRHTLPTSNYYLYYDMMKKYKSRIKQYKNQQK